MGVEAVCTTKSGFGPTVSMVKVNASDPSSSRSSEHFGPRMKPHHVAGCPVASVTREL